MFSFVKCLSKATQSTLLKRASPVGCNQPISLVWRGLSGSVREDVQKQFDRAMAAVKGDIVAPKEVTNTDKLKMYALFKQIEVGPCNTTKPGIFDPVGRAKHDAWSSLGAMSKEDAMKAYVQVVSDLFNGKLPEQPSSGTSASDSAAANGSVSKKPKRVTVGSIAFPKQLDPVDFKDLELSCSTVEVSSQGICKVTLNRPKRGNAFDMQLWEEYRIIFDSISRNADSRVVILSGAGGNFSTGMDLTVFADMNSVGAKETCEGRRREGIARFIQYLQDCTSAPEACPVPVISAISGHCIGGAIDIITACDLRYCTKNASFCVKEIDLAIVADMGTLQRLPRIVGEQRAAELTYTARTFNGQEAKEMGLVLECFDTEAEMMKHVEMVAARIASKSPMTVRGAKRTIHYSRDHTVQESLQYVKMWNSAYLQGDDLLEAMTSVMSKKEPEFRKN